MKSKGKNRSPNINIGAKYYTYDEDNNIILYRLYKVQNVDEYVFVDDNFNRHKVSHEEFKNFTKLIPDAYISFDILDLGYNTEDVMISLTRTEDVINNGGGFDPYCVCRQVYIDPYIEYYSSNADPVVYGICVNKDCSEQGFINSLYNTIEVVHSKVVSTYMDDDLDTILRFIPQARFNTVLYTFANRKDNTEISESGIFAGRKREGLTTCIKDLLLTNNFMNDFYSAFNITRVDIELKESTDDSFETFHSLQQILNKKLINPILIKYDNYVDLESIKRDYSLILDSNNCLYVLGYTDGGILKTIQDLT